ncbi:MAG: hypothetical protein ACR2QH_10460 [Geminicoccaceae bacterium]
MSNPSLDQAVLQTMNELMRASSDCAEFDPAMSAKFATAAKDMGRDLGITLVKPDPLESVASEHREEQDDDETRELLYLLDLQKRAIAEVEHEGPPKSRLSWLGLDVWSRW